MDITSFKDLENIPNVDELCGHTDVPILTDGEIVVFEAQVFHSELEFSLDMAYGVITQLFQILISRILFSATIVKDKSSTLSQKIRTRKVHFWSELMAALTILNGEPNIFCCTIF